MRPATITLLTALTHIRTLTVEHQHGFSPVFCRHEHPQGNAELQHQPQPLPGPGLYINKAQMFPTYPAINYLTNGAGHQYNAMTAEVKGSGSRGLSYQLSYARSRDIGDLERSQSSDNAYDGQRKRGSWVDIPTHNVTGDVMWELPQGRGKQFVSSAGWAMNLLIGNWAMSAIYTFRSAIANSSVRRDRARGFAVSRSSWPPPIPNKFWYVDSGIDCLKVHVVKFVFKLNGLKVLLIQVIWVT
jgi:hypothetical protein